MNLILTTIKLVLEIVNLGDATFNTAPGTYLTKEGSYEHAAAAMHAATPEIPASVLLGIAWVESRYSPEAVSRVENGKRLTGIPSWKSPPPGTHSFFCGVTQVSAGDSWTQCQKLQEVTVAYHVLVIELNRWLAPRVCNHNLACALTGYNGGFPAIKIGTRYAPFVMERAALIRRALHRKNI